MQRTIGTDSGTLTAVDVEIGYHPDGYRIDKSASPMNRYTQWGFSPEGEWEKPKPVCFDSLPETGWIKADGFHWADTSQAGLNDKNDPS